MPEDDHDIMQLLAAAILVLMAAVYGAIAIVMATSGVL